MKPRLVDVNWRFITAVDDATLVGVFFYRHGGANVYIEEMQVAYTHHGNLQVIEGFLKKLEFDKAAMDATFYANDRMQLE